MDSLIISVYCLSDDLLKFLHISDDPQSKMSTAEVMTSAIVSALYFGGKISRARAFLKEYRYIPNILSRERLNRKILNIPVDLWNTIFQIISRLLRNGLSSSEFIVDSFPVQACEPCRSWHCKIYSGKKYIGYSASKKKFYHGIKLHMLVSKEGIPVEYCFSPASFSDLWGIKNLPLELEEKSTVYSDRAYSSKKLEERIWDETMIRLLPQRKKKSANKHSDPVGYLINLTRKRIETTFSQIISHFPRYINARSDKGFELRVFLFILSTMFTMAV